jgi:hypothetical protein
MECGMNKTISEQIRDIIGDLEKREKPDMIFMSREHAERMALMLGISLEHLHLQFLDKKTEQNIFEVEDENT